MSIRCRHRASHSWPDRRTIEWSHCMTRSQRGHRGNLRMLTQSQINAWQLFYCKVVDVAKHLKMLKGSTARLHSLCHKSAGRAVHRSAIISYFNMQLRQTLSLSVSLPLCLPLSLSPPLSLSLIRWTHSGTHAHMGVDRWETRGTCPPLYGLELIIKMTRKILVTGVKK